MAHLFSVRAPLIDPRLSSEFAHLDKAFSLSFLGIAAMMWWLFAVRILWLPDIGSLHFTLYAMFSSLFGLIGAGLITTILADRTVRTEARFYDRGAHDDGVKSIRVDYFALLSCAAIVVAFTFDRLLD